MKRLLFYLIVAIFVAGCASTGYNNSNYSGIYQFKLLKPITVSAGSSDVYIMAPGKVVRRKEISNYDLYCKIAVPRPKESGELIINPDEFEINNIYRRMSELYHSPDTVQLAYYGGYGYGGIFRHHDASRHDLELFLSIHSINQPHVKSLSCIRFGNPFFDNAPTITEMQQVFKGLAEFSQVSQ